MSGFWVEGGQLVVEHGPRTVATTNGTLLQFLTDARTFSQSISYPDIDDVELYQWRGSVQRAPGDNFRAYRFARTVVGARPQEWSNSIVLGAVPAGADLFIGQATLQRTSAPSHTWLGTTITPVIPQNVPIQLTGSMLVEMTAGLCRSLTVAISGGNLVATLQHSVGPAAGNFTSHGVVPMVAPSTSIPPNDFNVGIENVAPSGAALPVWWPTTTGSNFIEGSGTTSGVIGGGQASAFCNSVRRSGSTPVQYTNPTNYSSTYSLTVTGRFGRRS